MFFLWLIFFLIVNHICLHLCIYRILKNYMLSIADNMQNLDYVVFLKIIELFFWQAIDYWKVSFILLKLCLVFVKADLEKFCTKTFWLWGCGHSSVSAPCSGCEQCLFILFGPVFKKFLKYLHAIINLVGLHWTCAAQSLSRTLQQFSVPHSCTHGILLPPTEQLIWATTSRVPSRSPSLWSLPPQLQGTTGQG